MRGAGAVRGAGVGVRGGAFAGAVAGLLSTGGRRYGTKTGGCRLGKESICGDRAKEAVIVKHPDRGVRTLESLAGDCRSRP